MLFKCHDRLYSLWAFHLKKTRNGYSQPYIPNWIMDIDPLCLIFSVTLALIG